MGFVASISRTRFASAFPLIGFEKRLDKPLKDLTATNQTVAKIGTWRVGAEGSVKKIFGAPLQWYLGGVLGKVIGKAYGEATVYRNQVGEWRIRGRATYVITW
jgi:hypothetical protein